MTGSCLGSCRCRWLKTRRLDVAHGPSGPAWGECFQCGGGHDASCVDPFDGPGAVTGDRSGWSSAWHAGRCAGVPFPARCGYRSALCRSGWPDRRAGAFATRVRHDRSSADCGDGPRAASAGGGVVLGGSGPRPVYGRWSRELQSLRQPGHFVSDGSAAYPPRPYSLLRHGIWMAMAAWQVLGFAAVDSQSMQEFRNF